MGKRGRARTPTVLLAARESRLVRNRKDEPKGDGAVPRCPAWLDPDSKKVWKRVVPKIEALGVLSAVDGSLLSILVQQISLYWHYATPRKGDPLDGEAELVPPDINTCLKILPGIIKLCDRFGLSPSARASLVVPDQKKQDDSKRRFFADRGVG